MLLAEEDHLTIVYAWDVHGQGWNMMKGSALPVLKAFLAQHCPNEPGPDDFTEDILNYRNRLTSY